MVKLYDDNDGAFLHACAKAGIRRPTRRQWRKWLQKRGKAWQASQQPR